MRKPEHRRAADRRGLRYPSDLTEAEWALIASGIPPARREGPTARGECSRGSERHLLRALDRLPMGGAAEGPAAEKHGARLLHVVGMG